MSLHFFRLSQKDKWEGKQSKNARAEKALWKTTVAFVKLMGIKFRGGGGAADGRSSGSPVGLSASAPALGATTKIHAHQGRAADGPTKKKPDCKTGLSSSEKGGD